MKRRLVRLSAIAATAVALTAIAFISAGSTQAAGVRRVSAVFDTSSDAGITGVLPDVPAFMARLRGGEAMRAFFDSPLDMHFLRSAPLRSAAHLHRLISLAPKSWQWSLYSLITDGPVFYRSQGSSFTLVIALNKKGKAITSLVKEASAARSGDWLVIASDKNTLQAQLAYMAKPAERESRLDAAFSTPSALSVLARLEGSKPTQRGLGRAIVRQALGLEGDSNCRLLFQPEGDSIGLEGECTTPSAKPTSQVAETIAMKEFPGYVYFRRAGQPRAHLIALGGFESDFGYLVPRLFFTGPVSDQKTVEFLSQAFKTRKHILEAREGAIQIRYPYPYTYSDRKFDLFAPYLSANRERFFWHSFLQEDKLREKDLRLNPEYNFYLSVKLFALLQNSEKAIRQFDAIYSPGHFHEFRDALFKSMPALRRTTVKLFATPAQGNLRLGGAIAFAED
ncbi:MAG: hypothetical protein ACOY5B_08500 [Spirochaetota bacterium]